MVITKNISIFEYKLCQLAFESYMRRKKISFDTATRLNELITQYFSYIGGDYHLEQKKIKGKIPADAIEQKVCDREPEPATITGLALYLGFSSRQAFEEYETKGKFADHLKRARLRIMADYEKKLHVTSSTGAIFALKSMGWNERPEIKPTDEPANTILKVEIIHTGPQLASSENEVVL